MKNKDLCQMVKQNEGGKNKEALSISLSISASLSFYLCVSLPLWVSLLGLSR